MYSSETSLSNNINEIQADVLLEDLSKNNLFSASTIDMLNKALNTKKKSIVPAINELIITMNTLRDTVNSAIDQQYEAIGSFNTRPELLDSLREIDSTVIEALIKTHTEVQDVKTTIAKTTKDVVFVMPKANPDTVKPEIYFPYTGYLKKVVANISDNETTERDVDIILSIEYLKDNVWTQLYEITLPSDKQYALKNITTDDKYIDNKILRVRVTQSKIGLTDLTVVATFKVNS